MNYKDQVTAPRGHAKAIAGISREAEFRPLFSLLARSLVLLTGMACLLVTGCEQPGSTKGTSPVPSPREGRVEAPVILGEGDVVKLFFPGAPEYNVSQKIRTDGKLSLPQIGEVQASGKTLRRLQSELSAGYKTQLVNSEVVVSLEASGKPVTLSGGVVTPGKIVLERPTTLLEALMGAGGFRDFARKKKVQVVRIVNGQNHTDTYDMSGAVTGRPTPVVWLKGGDIIYVPMSNW